MASIPTPSDNVRLRPANEGNPLVTNRRPARHARPARPIRPSCPTNTPVSSFRASRWAAPNITAQKANTINNADWVSYKLTTTKASLVEKLRHHIIRLHPKRYEEIPDPNNSAETISVPRKVDLLDPTEFARPIRLHRRDPSAPLGGLKETDAARLLADQQTPVYDEVKDAREELRARKEANRAEIAAKVAPYGMDNVMKKKSQFAKKTEQVFQHDQGNVQMRYEESQPWFIEDFDNGNTWQGQREQNLSGGRFVALLYNKNSKSFNMIPIEKWYKFREVNKYKMTSEEAAERKRQLDGVTPPWLKIEKTVEVKVEADEALTLEEARLYQKFSRRMGKGVVTSKGSEEVKAATDMEEVDYEQEFDNDDGGLLYGVDGDDDKDEQQEIKERVIKEQLSANSGLSTGTVYEEDNVAKTKVAAAVRTDGRKTRQFLRNREGNNNYDSDSDSNPYASSQEEDGDEIAARAEAVKIKVEARLKADADRKAALLALEAKKVADTAERRANDSEKRRENEERKKIEKELKATKPSSAVPAGLVPLGKIMSIVPARLVVSRKEGKEGKVVPAVTMGLAALGKREEVKSAAATTATPAEEARANHPSRSSKRTSGYITGFDSGSDSNSGGKKPKKKVKFSDEISKLEASVGIMSPPVSPILSPIVGPPSSTPVATRKRKNSPLPEEPRGEKKQRVDSASHSPSLAVAGQSRPALDLGPVTDEDLEAILRSHPDGITSKGIVAALKGRVGTGGHKALAVAIKRVGKVDQLGGKVLLKKRLM